MQCKLDNTKFLLSISGCPPYLWGTCAPQKLCTAHSMVQLQCRFISCPVCQCVVYFNGENRTSQIRL